MEASTPVPLEQVVYELLDAHQDTVHLAAQQLTSPDWEIHCEYLRDLQRVALEALGAAEVTSRSQSDTAGSRRFTAATGTG